MARYQQSDKVQTTWELRTYDVWGNPKDGYEVNDTYSAGSIDLALRIETCNAGTPHSFQVAHPTDKQIRHAFGIPRVRIDTDGDDLTIYVNRRRDGYPIGEMHCTSHASLSPIKGKENN